MSTGPETIAENAGVPAIATPPPATTPPQPVQRRALGALAVGATIAICWMAAPLGMGLLFGALCAFTMQPLYRALQRKMPRHPDLAALLCVFTALVLAFGAVIALGYVIIARGLVWVERMNRGLAAFGTSSFVRHAEQLGARWHVNLAPFGSHLSATSSAVLSRASRAAATFAGATAHLLLGIFFLAIAMQFTLRNWQAIVRHVQLLLPLDPNHSKRLLEDLRRVGKGVLLGTVITGLAQGTLAAIGYAIARAPDPAFFGAATAVASLVPALGTLLVWVPLGIALLAAGRTVAGIFVLVWGAAVVVGFADYVIRPRLVGDRGNPTLITFIAIFGGLEAFGLSGLILGPVLMALAVALLRLYEEQRSVTANAVRTSRG